MIIAVDFDETLHYGSKFPTLGTPRLWLIDKLIKMRKSGHKLILWTCRSDVYEEGEIVKPHLYLQEAIEFCKSYGLEFDAHNMNLSEVDEHTKHLKTSRKIYADVYIDDKSCYFNDTNHSLNLLQNNLPTALRTFESNTHVLKTRGLVV